MVTSPQCQLQQNRSDYMAYLYQLTDRANAEPGLVGTFTGLYLEHCERIGKETVERQVRNWHQQGEVITAEWGFVNK